MFNLPFEIFDISFVKIFGILIAIVFIIYRYQVLKLFFDESGKWKRREKKYKNDRLQFSRLPDELDEIINGEDNQHLPKTETKFHLLRVVNTNDEYLVYLSLTGNAITIIDINSNEFDLITVEPKDLLKNNSSFYFRFTLANPETKSILFRVIYEDQFTVKHKKNFLLSISDLVLKEIE